LVAADVKGIKGSHINFSPALGTLVPRWKLRLQLTEVQYKCTKTNMLKSYNM